MSWKNRVSRYLPTREPMGNRWEPLNGQAVPAGDFPRRGNPASRAGVGNRHQPATLPLDHAELERRVGFQSPHRVQVAFWLAWRRGEVERVRFTTVHYVAVAYCEDGEWYVTKVQERP